MKFKLVTALLLITLSGCITNTIPSSNSGSKGAPGPSGTSTSDDAAKASGATYKIANVTIAAAAGSASGASQQFNTTIFIDLSKSTGPINSSCNTSGTNSTSQKPCSCLFSWQEINEQGGSQIPIPRTVQTATSNVQSGVVVCAAPTIYATEILDGTTIKIRVVASGTNTEQFTVPDFNFVKKNNSVTGSFQDLNGNVFDSILRYSCYEQFKRGMAVQSFVDESQAHPQSGEKVSYVMASRFCVKKAGGGAGATQGCNNLPPQENSAQAYYYNLFVPDSRKGDINIENSRFKCPLVKENLRKTGVPDFWPLDSNFALSVNKTQSFQVGVEGFSQVSIGSDSTSVDQTCAEPSPTGGTPAPSSGSTAARLVRKCLGFASKPNPDGTCPYIKDTTGQIRFTYRLRRFVALYPPVFDTDGKMLPQAQAADTIYVLDRPVTIPTGSSDPLKPYTMRGPKPCPFAYFDHKGVLSDPNDADYPGGMPGYAATSFPGWTGTNIDGIEFPNQDIGGKSCSTAMPLFNATTNKWSIGTVNASNPNPAMRRVFVRPVQAWSPHYEEDTEFQACAPQSAPIVDAPLHFSKDATTGNVNWCAEVYPSQNPFVQDLERLNPTTQKYPGRVAPFTSHVVKNSVSPSCAATTFDLASITSGSTALYPANATGPQCAPLTESLIGAAHHQSNFIVDLTPIPTAGACLHGGTSDGTACYFCADRTCDRTVQSAGPSWPRFPLLARAPEVESAIAGDSTYGCTLTYDGGSGKTGKTTPREGCCGTNVSVWTGIPAAGSSQQIKNTSAHFEPTVNQPCLVPGY